MGLFKHPHRHSKMAVGKNKRLSKGKKGTKKKIVDPFSRKDWYDVKAPSNFNVRNIGKTVVTRTIGTKIASDGLKGRVFEMAQADLNQDEVAFRKFKLICEDVQGKNCMTNFHGMTKTTDGYLLRVFAIGFTRRRPNMNKKAAYAKSTQIRAIRKKMIEIITREVTTKDLKDVVNKLLPDSMGSDIEKSCQGIYPLHDCYIRKVKCLKKPKFDVHKLMEMHDGTTAAATPAPGGDSSAGFAVDRPDNYEPPLQETV